MKAVYLDHAATTPVRTEVREAMEPYLSESFGNPSSLHRWGREASAALEDARATVAESLGARAEEIYFTRGGTESDNLAVLGRCRFLATQHERLTLVVSAIEHSAVLDPAKLISECQGVDLITLPVSPEGVLNQELLRLALESGPTVVSVMWVNNETGLVFPVPDISELVNDLGGTIHTDAVQAVGKIPVNVTGSSIHLLTATGHKMHGPKGTGILFVRTGLQLAPLLHGGGQEQALRAGTEDVAGAVGFACSLQLAVEEQEQLSKRLVVLRSRLEGRLLEIIPGLRINVKNANRAPHISSIGIDEVDGEDLLSALDLEGIAASGGSACESGSTKTSHVITALYGPEDSVTTIRFSLGRETTEENVDQAVVTLSDVVARLRHLEVAS
ncbi:MAG TPA: cysteine desulfurase [Gemmatimonadetes bacterium]|jgi:cysteine desulfurase|nr:cysteine desulfurase [Gemmatimonadota bacterium]HIB08438.1 cysteine desulfurase [Gemmatimonadota bacterium]HIC15464.1 cysteine desulfurase [Gemmatimonadota bacterium]